MALAASLVCRVESTRCPVSDAWIAISAVSRSRISPTRMTSGSWRMIERSAAPKVRPALLVHLDLHDAGQPVLDGILDRDDVDAARLHLAQRGVERRRLAGAGGTGDEHEPLALLEQRADAREVGVAEADDVERAETGAAVEHADDDLLAVRRGERGDAQVDHRAAHGDARASVLRTHPVGDVEPGEDLDARDERRRERPREQREPGAARRRSRWRTAIPCSSGSMWMSLAPAWIPSARS